MKKKLIQYNLFLFLCALFGGIFSLVGGQYYYFDNGSNAPLQQGCNESLTIKINTENQQTRAGRFHLILDTGHFSYSTSDVSSILRTTLFNASSNVYADRSSASSPSRQAGSNHSILQIDRKNDLTNYNGNGGLYGTIFGLVPFFSTQEYTGFVAMQYIPGPNTTETTLSAVGGVEIINSAHQIPRMTGYFYVQQTPCISDTTAPTFTLNVPTIGTKKSHLSGITLTLNDNVGVAGTNVPYVRTGGSVWTGNVWGINNQYGINLSTFKIRISGNGTSAYFTGGMFSPTGILSAVPNGKTWQFLDKNYAIAISGSELFDYGIEKPIIISGTIQDRMNNITNYGPLTLNAPVAPWLIAGSANPAAGAIWIDAIAPVNLGIADDWAGVHSGSIRVTLSGVAGTDYGPYVFSGNDLHLSGVAGSANQPDYYITISDHVIFPYSGTIQVHVDAIDMAGTQDNIHDYTFGIRPSCAELGCCNQVYIQTGNNPPFFYTGTDITVSGGINPSFTGNGNTGIIDCGTANQGMHIYKGTEINSGIATHLSFFDFPSLIFSGISVKAVLSGNTVYLQKIYIPPITGGCIGSCGGGGGLIIEKDDCTLPSTLACANDDGIDASDSYYDETCCSTEEGGHGAAPTCDISDSPYSQEITDAFSRSYDLNITNKCPIEEAQLEKPLLRKDLAKMMTLFMIQIVGIYPETHKPGCDAFTDINDLSDEMKFYAKTSCQLYVMGLHPDGKTPKNVFDPNDPVPRTQLGTVLSRLIYGDVYNVYSGEELTYKRYEKHLKALNEANIMKKIQDPFMIETRARAILMLKRVDDEHLVEKYRLVAPAHNGALSLLDNIR